MSLERWPDGIIQLIKVPLNSKIEFKLGQEVSWVKTLLLEMNENATDKKPENYLAETSLFITGEMEKKHQNHMGDYLLVRGTITADYATECVRTLRPMHEKLEVSFKTVFISEHLASDEQFAEIDETYLDNDVFEIYFFKKNMIDLPEMIHEQIFLHYNQYPILDAESLIDGSVDSTNPKQ